MKTFCFEQRSQFAVSNLSTVNQKVFKRRAIARKFVAYDTYKYRIF
ncbi:hypothetical protein [Nostoc sp.]